MKVLIVGKGGREHAILWKIKQSPLVDKIYVTQGNAGMCEEAECLDIPPDDIEKILKFAKEVDVVIVGPEDPLAKGIINELPKGKGFGPVKEAATIESDKAFAKELCKKLNIPIPEFKTFTNYDDAIKYIDEIKTPIVIKAAGLAAGKGSFIVKDKEEAKKKIKELMVDKVLGKSGEKVVIEEYLEGYEASFFCFTDGKDFVMLPTAQDYKRLYDGDEGPNTGGMGSISPAPHLKNPEEIIEKIAEPVIWGLKKEGAVYKGILYVGLMITEEGPKVLEFNCRFGDPETQAILPLVESDIMPAILATIEERLKEINLKFKDEKSVCVVAASGGYPGKYEKGFEIEGLNDVKDAIVFHAGTKKEGDKVLTAGGRVLSVVAIDKDFEKAREKAYREISKIKFEKMHYRKDIAL